MQSLYKKIVLISVAGILLLLGSIMFYRQNNASSSVEPSSSEVSSIEESCAFFADSQKNKQCRDAVELVQGRYRGEILGMMEEEVAFQRGEETITRTVWIIEMNFNPPLAENGGTVQNGEVMVDLEANEATLYRTNSQVP